MLKHIQISLFLILFFSLAITACEEAPIPPPDEPVPAWTDDIDIPLNVPYVEPDVSDEELEKFAHITFWTNKHEIDPVQDADEYKNRINEIGLTVHRYREIYLFLQLEPELRLDLYRVMNELRNGGNSDAIQR